MENFSRNRHSGDTPFTYPNQQDKPYRDFWDEALDRKGLFSEKPFSDPDFRNYADQLAEEEFFDAAKILDGKHNIFDMKFATNLNLDKSGMRDDGHVPRTRSMSPSDSDCISVSRYFQRRSAYSGHPGLDRSEDHLNFLSRPGAKDRDYDGHEVEHGRSTLTKHDLLDIIDANDANRIRKQKGPSSVCSTSSSVRSSIGTIAALEELDRILHEDSSENEDANSPSSSPPPLPKATVPSRRPPPVVKNQTSVLPSQNGTCSHCQMDSRREKNQNFSQIFVPKLTKNSIPAAKPAVNDVNRISGNDVNSTSVESQQSEQEIRREPVMRNSFNKPFEISSKAAEMLDRLLKTGMSETYSENKQMLSKEKFHRSSLPSQSSRDEKPRSYSDRKPSQADRKTEEILRRANNVLARVERMKAEEAFEEYSPAPNKSNFPPPIERERNFKRPAAPPRGEPLSTAPSRGEPLSTAQGRNPASISTNRHVQTETETSLNYSNTVLDLTDEISLLEQTTYPLTRSSQDARDVVLATHRIFFPPTEVGESSSAKLQIKNYTAVPHQLRFGFTRNSPVFQNRYDNLNIQPKRYLNVPLRFTPNATGYFETKMKIEIDGPLRKEMIVDIVGEGIPRLSY